MDIIEIGLFQLENLIIARSPFLFLNLGAEEIEVEDARLASYLKQATSVHPDRLESFLLEKQVLKEYPIVLLCEDGRVSRAQGLLLDKNGYSNVYVIENGLQGLLSEARSFLTTPK